MQWLVMLPLMALALLFEPPVAWGQKPPPLPSPGDLQFTDNYAGDETKVVFWWNDGWLPPKFDIEGTGEVDPASPNYCLIQPTYHRFIFGYNEQTRTYSIAPAKAVIVDMNNTTDNPCVPDLFRLYIPRIWHARLVPHVP